jgi:membrane-associated phospholipid phosphatase
MTLANRNLDAIPMNRHLRTGVKVANVLLSSGTAWARVEAKKHFPTDVLVGTAMGRFFTVFIHDAWLLPDDTFYVDFTLGRNVFGMAMSWRF